MNNKVCQGKINFPLSVFIVLVIAGSLQGVILYQSAKICNYASSFTGYFSISTPPPPPPEISRDGMSDVIHLGILDIKDPASIRSKAPLAES